MFSQSRSQIKLTNRVTSLVAFLFVIYALADVSVLQIYCGNEALGIPPSHHVTDDVNLASYAELGNFVTVADSDRPRSPEHEYDHQHECFCWHQTLVVSYRFSHSKVTAKSQSQSPDIHTSRHKATDLDIHFRPPQLT